MISEKKKRNIYLDLFKIFLCGLVICIHFADASKVTPLYRLAVPMFFMISGYFTYTNNNEERIYRAFNFSKRCAYYMFFGVVFYTIYNLIYCFINDKNVSVVFVSLYMQDFFKNFFLLNETPLQDAHHLWFIIALFVVSLIHLILIKLKKEKLYLILIPILTVVHLFFNGYVIYTGGTIVELHYTRNAIFFGLPMFAIGYCVRKYIYIKTIQQRYLCLFLGFLFSMLQIVEAIPLSRELYISSILGAVFLLIFFTSLQPVDNIFYYKWFGKSMTFFVYIIHIAVGNILNHFFTFPHYYLKCLTILIVSILIYEICFLIIKLTKPNKSKTP